MNLALMGNFRLFDLNDAQRSAVTQTEGAVLILAGAGTGKTRVITARISYMVRNQIDPTNILAVTFTNKASNEMRDRVAGMIDASQAKKLTIGTFHALCVRILRQSIDRLGYKKNFTIYTESDQNGLLKKIITRTAAKDEKIDPWVAKSLISRAKNDGLTAPPEDDESLLAEIFRRYSIELKRLNAVDFDDLLLLAVKIIKEHQDVLDQLRARYHYIMVDEFQDTNQLQLDLVSLLAGDKTNICVVGDDDQSIYSWRGAEVSNILDFERHFPNPLVIKLEQNYRSTNAILNTANSLIEKNKRRRPKRLWSDHGDGDKIRLIPLDDDAAEAEWIASEIKHYHIVDQQPYENVAILFRMNAQSRLLETNLRAQEIPYKIIGGKSFYDKREVKDLIAYANVILNPDDDVSLLRIVNNPPRGIGATTVERALQESIADKCSLYAALQADAFHATLSTRASNAIARFTAQLDQFETKLNEPLADAADVLTTVMTESGYFEALQRSCKTPEETLKRETSIRQVIDDLRHYQSKSKKGLRGFLDKLALKDEKDDKEEQGTGVTLITLHAAKGLEFPIVYLVGVEEGIIPHERSKSEGNVDEERRLFYVGITRAMKKLTLTRCVKRKRWGQDTFCEPSSFLEELSDTHIEHCDAEELSNEPATDEDAKSYFAKMREALGG